MAVPFYDNLEATPIHGLSCLVEVERIYGLDWDRFDDDHWRGLTRIDKGLPWPVRYRDAPWWFGADEDVPPFLCASMGPTGLQVHGVLPEADRRAWDERFRATAGALPCRIRQWPTSDTGPAGPSSRGPSDLPERGRPGRDRRGARQRLGGWPRFDNAGGPCYYPPT